MSLHSNVGGKITLFDLMKTAIKIANYLCGCSSLVIQHIENAYFEVYSNCGYFGDRVIE